MSNMYGYTDYDGPRTVTAATIASSSLTPLDQLDDDNPLQVGFWMEGDSLAPPCGTSVSTIHTMLQFLQLDADHDVLYDLGCGDGRICLEAWHQFQCRTIGIEVEEDLVARAQTLIANVSTSSSQCSLEPLRVQNLPQVHCMDLRQIFREWMRTTHHNNDTADNDTKFPLPTILFLYLLPEALSEMKSSLLQILNIAKNCRIVCNTWGIPNWNPIQTTTIPERTAVGVSTTMYVYTADSVPETSRNAE